MCACVRVCVCVCNRPTVSLCSFQAQVTPPLQTCCRSPPYPHTFKRTYSLCAPTQSSQATHAGMCLHLAHTHTHTPRVRTRCVPQRSLHKQPVQVRLSAHTALVTVQQRAMEPAVHNAIVQRDQLDISLVRARTPCVSLVCVCVCVQDTLPVTADRILPL